MRQLRPVDVIVDLDLPESGFISDETMDGPYWITLDASRTFFGRRSRAWLYNHYFAGHLVLDGQPVQIPRRESTDRMHWRLIDVERAAHALARGGYLDLGQLVRVIEMVRLVAESWGYVQARTPGTRIEPFDPNRQGVYVVAQEPEVLDDLDGSEGAAPRTFALGGTEYYIDLNDEHWNDVVAALGPYIKVARRGNSRADRRHGEGPATRAEIRAWARENGYPISDYGVIPMPIRRAYHNRKQS